MNRVFPRTGRAGSIAPLAAGLALVLVIATPFVDLARAPLLWSAAAAAFTALIAWSVERRWESQQHPPAPTPPSHLALALRAQRDALLGPFILGQPRLAHRHSWGTTLRLAPRWFSKAHMIADAQPWRLPYVQQRGPTCGLAALSMCLAETQPCPLENLLGEARDLGYTDQGELFDPAHLVDLARRHGLDAQLHRHAALDDIVQALKRGPVIVPYASDASGYPHWGSPRVHYAVITGAFAGPGVAYLVAQEGKAQESNPQIFLAADFLKAWHGIASTDFYEQPQYAGWPVIPPALNLPRNRHGELSLAGLLSSTFVSF